MPAVEPRTSYDRAVTDCRLIRGGSGFRGKQGLDYFSGVSAESTGAKAICMHLLEMPPGSSAKPHYHEDHETVIFVLEGVAEMRHGSQLEHVMRTEAGDFVYIPAGVPHQPYNPTDMPVRAVIARTDPNEQESVVLLEEAETA
ncbi:MAG TPA: cupin domain-containing protein [Gaiellaceae bacterium]